MRLSEKHEAVSQVLWRLTPPNNIFSAAFSTILLRKIVENAALKILILPPRRQNTFYITPVFIPAHV